MLTAAGVTATDGCYYLRGGLFGELLFPVKKFHSLTFFTAVKFTAVAKIENYFEKKTMKNFYHLYFDPFSIRVDWYGKLQATR